MRNPVADAKLEHRLALVAKREAAASRERAHEAAEDARAAQARVEETLRELRRGRDE